MKLFTLTILSIFISSGSIFPKAGNDNYSLPYDVNVIRAQSQINGNNISSWIMNTGVFNQDIRIPNTPGFEWPKGSGKFAIFTTGLTIGAYMGNDLKFASISYNGEYAPGYAIAGTAYTDANFKLYKIKKGDNAGNNPDYANWGLMVPFGAPYIDVNGNGQYTPLVDEPGIKGAAQVIFECITDGFPENHTGSEGFSGGTAPLYSEMHLTAWCYDSISQFADVQFLKMGIINKSNTRWDSTFFGLLCDPDLGMAMDDYIGCDIIRNLGYCYNASDQDGSGSGSTYGLHPPAIGIDFLKAAHSINSFQNELGLTSFNYFTTGTPGIICEQDPYMPIGAYNYLKGVKKDGTPWVNAFDNNITKYCYSGDPETNSGWTEYRGCIKNCNGTVTGLIENSNPGDRRFIMSSGSLVLTVNPLDTQTFIISQMAARGTNNKNSVTKLKQLDDAVQNFYNNNFIIGVNNISSIIPDKYFLHQNYPNPFNPSTKIKFEVPQNDFINLTVFDITGKLVEELVNEKLSAGTFEAIFSAKNLSSGIYFYQLKSSAFIQTKKMILTK